jgi:hypothetical protein
VIPLHVVAGFLESDRGIRDSGVLGKYGIMVGDRAVSSKKQNNRGTKHQKIRRARLGLTESLLLS